MKMFSDEELKNEIRSIHFGLVEAGSQREVSVYLLNDSKAVLSNLEFSLKGKENLLKGVQISNKPRTMQPGSTAKLSFSWTPDFQLKEALELDLEIKASEIYYSLETLSRMKKQERSGESA